MNVLKVEETPFSVVEKGENVAQVSDKNVEDENSKYDPLFYCRTCASKDAFFIPIFKGEGINHELNKKIEKYLPIQITKDDDLPLQLCYNCASTIIAWDTLVVGCIEAEQKLKSLQNANGKLAFSDIVNSQPDNEVLPGPCQASTSDTVDSDDEPLITKKQAVLKVSKKKGGSKKDALRDGTEVPAREDAGHEPERADSDEDLSRDWDAIPKSWLDAVSCKHCGWISCESKDLREHERRGTCARHFECRVCGRRFAKRTNLERHARKHDDDDGGSGGGDGGEDGKRFACGVCNRKFKFEDNGLSHEKLCGRAESTFKCSVCGKRFETKGLAEQHSTSHHKSCVCHVCGQSFGKPESLKQHMKTVHEESKMVCHYCGREFARKARLQEHLQHHTGQMDFTCHVCGKGSTNAYSFGVHLATHTQETPFPCSFCPRTFKHTKYVYLHERAVHLKLKSGKAYVKPKRPGKNVAERTCPHCDKTFKRESAMLIHKRSVHEGKNGYICKICGKDFKYTYLLYVHKKKHHFPELCKYACQFCDKPFPVKTELEKHMRKHTGEKPYVCNICGKTYSFHGSLNMHVKTRHENRKDFKCDSCDASFNFRSHLARHVTSAHADKFAAGASRVA